MFKATGGGALALKKNKFKLTASASFQTVIDFLRKQLRCPPSEPLVSTVLHGILRRWHLRAQHVMCYELQF
jgi:hypothetical protein